MMEINYNLIQGNTLYIVYFTLKIVIFKFDFKTNLKRQHRCYSEFYFKKKSIVSSLKINT